MPPHSYVTCSIEECIGNAQLVMAHQSTGAKKLSLCHVHKLVHPFLLWKKMKLILNCARGKLSSASIISKSNENSLSSQTFVTSSDDCIFLLNNRYRYNQLEIIK